MERQPTRTRQKTDHRAARAWAKTNQHLRGEIGNAARTVLDAIEIAHDLSHLVESRFHNEHSDWVCGIRKLTKKAREMAGE